MLTRDFDVGTVCKMLQQAELCEISRADALLAWQEDLVKDGRGILMCVDQDPNGDGDPNKAVYRSTHLTLQEYFAATQSVANARASGNVVKSLKAIFGVSPSPWLREILLMVVEMLTPEEFKQLADYYLDNDDGSGAANVRVTTFLKCRREDTSSGVGAHIQQRLSQARPIELLAQALCHPNEDLRTQGLTEIIEFGISKEDVITKLLAILRIESQDEPWFTKVAGTQSLAKLQIANQPVLNFLVAISLDRSVPQELCVEALRGLKTLGSENVDVLAEHLAELLAGSASDRSFAWSTVIQPLDVSNDIVLDALTQYMSDLEEVNVYVTGLRPRETDECLQPEPELDSEPKRLLAYTLPTTPVGLDVATKDSDDCPANERFPQDVLQDMHLSEVEPEPELGLEDAPASMPEANEVAVEQEPGSILQQLLASADTMLNSKTPANLASTVLKGAFDILDANIPELNLGDSSRLLTDTIPFVQRVVDILQNLLPQIEVSRALLWSIHEAASTMLSTPVRTDETANCFQLLQRFDATLRDEDSRELLLDLLGLGEKTSQPECVERLLGRLHTAASRQFAYAPLLHHIRAMQVSDPTGEHSEARRQALEVRLADIEGIEALFLRKELQVGKFEAPVPFWSGVIKVQTLEPETEGVVAEPEPHTAEIVPEPEAASHPESEPEPELDILPPEETLIGSHSWLKLRMMDTTVDAASAARAQASFTTALVIKGHPMKTVSGVFRPVAQHHNGWPYYRRDDGMHLFYYVPDKRWQVRSSFQPDDHACRSYTYAPSGLVPIGTSLWYYYDRSSDYLPGSMSPHRADSTPRTDVTLRTPSSGVTVAWETVLRPREISDQLQLTKRVKMGVASQPRATSCVVRSGEALMEAVKNLNGPTIIELDARESFRMTEELCITRTLGIKSIHGRAKLVAGEDTECTIEIEGPIGVEIAVVMQNIEICAPLVYGARPCDDMNEAIWVASGEALLHECTLTGGGLKLDTAQADRSTQRRFSSAQIRDCVIQDCVDNGVAIMDGAQATLHNSTVRRCAGSGIYVCSGARGSLISTIVDDCHQGIFVQGGKFDMAQSRGDASLHERRTTLEIRDTRVERNHTYGIGACDKGTVHVFGDTVVQDNQEGDYSTTLQQSGSAAARSDGAIYFDKSVTPMFSTTDGALSKPTEVQRKLEYDCDATIVESADEDGIGLEGMVTELGGAGGDGSARAALAKSKSPVVELHTDGTGSLEAALELAHSLLAPLCSGDSPALVDLRPIGSYGIPGLPAKRSLDLVAIVSVVPPAAGLIESLAGLGFKLKPRHDHSEEDWMLARNHAGDIDMFLHIHATTLPWRQQALAFRAFLEHGAHVAQREAYAAAKVAASSNLLTYFQNKAPVVKDLMAQATRWAGEGGLIVGPTPDSVLAVKHESQPEQIEDLVPEPEPETEPVEWWVGWEVARKSKSGDRSKHPIGSIVTEADWRAAQKAGLAWQDLSDSEMISVFQDCGPKDGHQYTGEGSNYFWHYNWSEFCNGEWCDVAGEQDGEQSFIDACARHRQFSVIIQAFPNPNGTIVKNLAKKGEIVSLQYTIPPKDVVVRGMDNLRIVLRPADGRTAPTVPQVFHLELGKEDMLVAASAEEVQQYEAEVARWTGLRAQFKKGAHAKTTKGLVGVVMADAGQSYTSKQVNLRLADGSEGVPLELDTLAAASAEEVQQYEAEVARRAGRRKQFKKGTHAKTTEGLVGVVVVEAKARGYYCDKVNLRLADGSEGGLFETLELDTLEAASVEEYEAQVARWAMICRVVAKDGQLPKARSYRDFSFETALISDINHLALPFIPVGRLLCGTDANLSAWQDETSSRVATYRVAHPVGLIQTEGQWIGAKAAGLLWWRDLSSEEKAAVNVACPDKNHRPFSGEGSQYIPDDAGYNEFDRFSRKCGEWYCVPPED